MHMCCGRPPEQCTHAPRAARSTSGALWHDGALFAVGDRIAAECSRAASEHVRGTTLAARCAQPHHLASVDGRGPGARNSGSKSSTGARERRPSSCRACWTATEKKKECGPQRDRTRRPDSQRDCRLKGAGVRNRLLEDGNLRCLAR